MTSPRQWIVRLASPADAEQIAGIYRPIVEETAISFELEPPTAAEMSRRIQSVLAYERPWLVAVRGGTIAGYAYATRYRERPGYAWSSESSVCVAPDARRLGVARALYTCLLSLLRIQRYGSVFAAIALPNPASIRLHEQVGFSRVGTFRGAGYKHDRWHDVEWWQSQPTPSEEVPVMPLTLLAAQQTPEWSAAIRNATLGIRA